ncbi:pentatricopeptide repeat-containing protein At1g03540-like [Cryptomeria japonica]|uniref:pentatricopeptide repeat-containing protein At1g03540-like n=1 Tax=Cryptomeria japonica TaxID=3369 RepID=UPI0027DA35B9|nr:pentatricopeptide repeat-containing protein At1g03540-like [Cryptomeria japonica]
MKGRYIVSWNNIINAYRRHGFPQEALKLFHQMQRTALEPNHLTFSSVLSACAKMGALRLGKDIHHIMKRGIFSNVVVATALKDMYTKCGRVHKAIVLFGQMQRTGLQLNQFTFSTVVSACAEIVALKRGMDIHRSIMESGFFSNVVVATALMDFTQNVEVRTRHAKFLTKCFKEMTSHGLQ